MWTGIKTLALARYHKDGSLDQSFFGGNISASMARWSPTLCVGKTDGSSARSSCVADGKILAAGFTNAQCAAPKSAHFALARYTAQGTLDTTFSADDGNCIPGTIVTILEMQKRDRLLMHCLCKPTVK